MLERLPFQVLASLVEQPGQVITRKRSQRKCRSYGAGPCPHNDDADGGGQSVHRPDGELTGRISDASSAVLPGASVTVTNAETGKSGE
jgi:hypothetical protein